MVTAPLTVLQHDELHRILALVQKEDEGYPIDLSCSIIEDFDFSGLALQDVQAQQTHFIRCRFVAADLYGAHLSYTTAIGADFRHSVLVNAEIFRANLSKACFNGANLSRTMIRKTQLNGASFVNADLHGSSFVGCDLTNAVFDGAEMVLSNFRDCILEGVSWANVKR